MSAFIAVTHPSKSTLPSSTLSEIKGRLLLIAAALVATCLSVQVAAAEAVWTNEERSAWVTLGGEYRFRIESLTHPAFALRSIEDFTAIDQRWLIHADIHTTAGPRAFVQLSAAAEQGRQPQARPFDRSAVDLAQGFVDWPLRLSAGTLSFRLGRQELDLHGNRLVGVRDAANLRRAFDLATANLTRRGMNITAFTGRPVRNDTGAFDDDRDPGENFAGASIEFTAAASRRVTTLFYFDRKRARAVYHDFTGSERRHTFGARYIDGNAAYDVALQVAVQSGHAGANEFRAYGLGGDFGLRRPQWPLRPRFGISFGVASGDERRDDGRLGTFDVIYPNLSYFTDAPIFYPGNTTDVQPNLTARWSDSATTQSGCDFIFRQERADGIYDPPGVPLVRGGAAGSNDAARLCYIKHQWQFNSHLEFVASYVSAHACSALKEVGGRSAHYWLLQAALKL